MGEPECRLARNVLAGSVLVPEAVEHPASCRDWIGQIVTRDLPARATLSPGDVLLVDQDELRLLDGSNLVRKQVVALDQRIFGELRMAYADEPWTAVNFDYPLPGKFHLSFVASRGPRVLGFWIASERVAGEAHTHRVAVDSSSRNGVLSRRLFCAFWRAAITRGSVRRMTVELGADNARARSFYETLGFYAASPGETKSYLEARGRSETIDGVDILGSGGGRSIVMLRRVETEL